VFVFMVHDVLPPPRQKVCKVFEVDTLGLDFGLRLASESKSPAWAGPGSSTDFSLSAMSMVSRRANQARRRELR
jgi:hypothetical protein